MDAETAPLLNSPEEQPASSSLRVRVRQVLKRARLTGLERWLLPLALALVCVAALGFGLFAGEVSHDKSHHHRHRGAGRPGRRDPVVPPTTPSKNDDICMTKRCVTVAARVIESLDESVDPCDDFYHFANGGWLKTHPVPEDVPLYGSAQDIGVRNKRVIAEILSSAGAGSLEQTSDADKENVKTLRDFYEACVDEDRVDRQGDEPLLEPVRHVIDLWRGAASTSEFQRLFAPLKASKPLTDALVYLHSRGVPALFEITAQGDLKNDPEDMMAWVSQSGLGLPSLDYYDEKAVVDVYTEVVRSSLKSIYGALEGEGLAPGKPYSTLAHDIVAFEKQIAKVSLDVVDIEDPIGTYNPLKLGALQKLLPQVSFSDYFAGQGSYMPDRVIVTSPSYLGNLSAIVADTDATVLEGYFVFRLAQELGPLLGPKTTTHKEIAWMENYLGGVDEGVRKSRADMCLEAVEENLGFLIGRYYVQRAFAGDSREYAEDIIGATIDAFKARLPELDWLDQETRDAAEVKASAILRHIGFPDQTPDTTNAEALRRYYKPNMPITSTDFFGNVLRTRTADVKRMWAQLGKPRDHGLWEMVPSEVNAYMNPPTNDLFFPAGIMQEPYFSKDWPEYQAFGAFGALAGHELSHAFDSAGRLYDQHGKLVDWWTKETADRFADRQACLVDQYANYTIADAEGHEYHVNSKFTIGEDMADAGGLAQAFRAWRDRFESDRHGDDFDNYLLPGLNYTREQVFFIAYAQGWARNIKPAEAVRRIRTDPHSPTMYRVIGPLSNDVNFREAFKCPVGSRMANVDRCSIW